MKTAEYYVKVEVKTKADLPKDNGDYFAHRIGYFEISLHTFKIGVPKMHMNHAYYPIWWIKNVDWYLLPVQIELPSEVKIYEQADLKFDYWGTRVFWASGANWAVEWIKDKMK